VTAPVVFLSEDERRLLATFHDSIAIWWDPEALDWTVGSDMFSLGGLLVSRLDRFLLDGWIAVVEVPGRSLWQVVLTDAGRAVLS